MADDVVRQNRRVAVAVFVYFETIEEFRRGSSRSTSFFFLRNRERFRTVSQSHSSCVLSVRCADL